ncbi:RING finger protein 17 [Liparis tanakae]|uniref:RING finger protein 17 n=1 Tax=Liparis tanakae TaxID=230148 RepID=A0A4Z2H5Z5_9TELE|nr:RING finger protein 17 [Liparis tanakae]
MEFVLLSAKLQDWYKEPREEQRVSVPVLHQACVALYEDRKWYRAQVTGRPGGRQVEVQYVDFGNKKLVSVSDLRKIKDEFFSVPSRAIHCCLSDVVPPDGDVWTEACRRRFISLAHQKLVIVMATGEPPQTQPLPVRLFESSLDGPLDSIAELLVQEQLASFTEGLEPPAEGEPAVWDPPLESGSALPAVEEAQSEEALDLPSQLKLIHQLKDLNVRVSHVNSPSSFYVQLGQSGPQLQRSGPQRSGVRAQRMSELVEEQCEHLEHQDLVWELDQELTEERPVPVTLLRSNETGKLVSMADFLDSKGPAAPPGTRCAGSDGDPVPPVPPTPQPRPAPRTVASAEKVETGPYRPPSLPGLGPASLRVTAVGEDGLLHARTPDAEAVRRRLGERLQQSMKTLPRQRAYTWRTVRGLAVRGPDMLWYRGQLLELLGGHVKVQDVDSGLVENIPVVHVYPTLLCDDTPQLSVSCQLHGIQPVGGRWQCDAVALLRELLLSRRVDVEVRALRGPEDAVLGPFISPKLPQEGEPFQVKVKHLRTPNELFLWPLEGSSEQHLEGEHLEEALSRINDDMEATQHLTDMRQGGPCLAQYSDGRFYRARVDALSGVEPVRVLVQHVDFGSEDSLPPARLRRLPAALLRFPPQALEVKVSGFGPPSGGGEQEEEEGAVLSYSPGWSLKATMDMLHMLHGHITAAIVAREPELTVLLYNEDGELVHLPLVSSGLAELE